MTALLYSLNRGFPAHAGIDRSSMETVRLGRWVPRPRGDRPRIPAVSGRAMITGVPRPRGDRPHIFTWIAHACGFPAHAGIDITYHCRDIADRPEGFPAHAGIDRPGSWELA